MTKYHINKQGLPAPCKAQKGNCPFGGGENHYDTIDQAQQAADEINQKQFGLITEITTLDAADFIAVTSEEIFTEDLAYAIDPDTLEEINQYIIDEHELDIDNDDESATVFMEISEEIDIEDIFDIMKDEFNHDESLNTTINQLAIQYSIGQNNVSDVYANSVLKEVDVNTLNNISSESIDVSDNDVTNTIDKRKYKTYGFEKIPNSIYGDILDSDAVDQITVENVVDVIKQKKDDITFGELLVESYAYGYDENDNFILQNAKVVIPVYVKDYYDEIYDYPETVTFTLNLDDTVCNDDEFEIDEKLHELFKSKIDSTLLNQS